MHRMQARRLLFLEKQEAENPHRAGQVLPLVQKAHSAQRDQISPFLRSASQAKRLIFAFMSLVYYITIIVSSIYGSCAKNKK